MKVFYFGNPYMEEDSLAIRIAEKLKASFPNIEFIYLQDSFQILSRKEELNDSIILDIIKGLKSPRLIHPEDIKKKTILTSHDFDLGEIVIHFKLKTRIIGIPPGFDEKPAFEQASRILSLILGEKPNI